MGILSCTIGGNAVNVQFAPGQSFLITAAVEVPFQLQLTVEDAAGTLSFTRGQPIVLSDSVKGVLYAGTVLSSQMLKAGPGSTLVEHTITCTDKQYPFIKRANTTNYLNWYAGDVAVDFVNRTLAAEGVTVAAALRRDSTQTDFAQGLLSGTIATSNVDDGNLELAQAGSNLSFTESVTADFAAGTLTNVVAANNTLKPTTVSAMKFSAVLNAHIAIDVAYIQIWSGSLVVGTLDTLNYSIWIDGGSAAKVIGLDLGFSDGTFLRTTTTAIDQNGIPATPTSDLSSFAINQWYTRAISLPAALNGKTVNSVLLATTGQSAGNYLAYFKNIFLTSQSGSPFFSTSATATNVNPPVVTNSLAYLPAQVAAPVVQTYDPTSAIRISPAHSIDAVKLLRSSVISWVAVTPATSVVQLWASYDGINFSQCTMNSALPNLPAGSSVAGLSLYLKEVFTVTAATSGSSSTTNPDPTQLPILTSVSVTLNSAPNPTSAKSDVVAGYGTQTAWNTGTLTGTNALANGDLTIGTSSRWGGGIFTNQTFTIVTGSPTQGLTSGKYFIGGSANAGGASNFDFAGQVADFTLDMDIQFAGTGGEARIYYRNPIKTVPSTSAYFLELSQISSIISLFLGSTAITANFPFTFTNGTTYHIKIAVNGSLHLVYIVGVLQFSLIDNTNTSPGYITVEAFSGSSGITTNFSNFVLTPATSGTWQSPATSISALGTCGPSILSWTELNTTNQVASSVLMQTSVDGGSTFQTCSNGGAVPNIPLGTNVAGKSVIIKATLAAFSQPVAPILRQLILRVLGAYPGSTGTRTTLPMAIDTAIRANQAGFGTASDGQVWVKTGTGADAVSSNTLTLTNTTGDVHEVIGSRVWTDEDVSIHFQFSASTMTPGIELRYIDGNNHCRLSVTTTVITITRVSYGITMVLGTVVASLSTGILYRMRFRVNGTYPVNFNAKVWLDTIAEPAAWSLSVTE
jgi:hypothetical protein